MQITPWILCGCLWVGACASPSSTHAGRSATVALNIEQDLARTQARIAEGQALLTQNISEQQRQAVAQSLHRAQFAFDAAQLELAAFKNNGDPIHVRSAGAYSSVAFTHASAASRGELVTDGS